MSIYNTGILYVTSVILSFALSFPALAQDNNSVDVPSSSSPPIDLNLPFEAIPEVSKLGGFTKRANTMRGLAGIAFAIVETSTQRLAWRKNNDLIYDYVSKTWPEIQNRGSKGFLSYGQVWKACDINGNCIVRTPEDKLSLIGYGEHPLHILINRFSDNQDNLQAAPSIQSLVDSGYIRDRNLDFYVWFQENKDGSLSTYQFPVGKLRQKLELILLDQEFAASISEYHKNKNFDNLVKSRSKNIQSEEVKAKILELSQKRTKLLKENHEINSKLKNAIDEANKSNRIAENFSLLSDILGLSAASVSLVNELGLKAPQKAQEVAKEGNIDQKWTIFEIQESLAEITAELNKMKNQKSTNVINIQNVSNTIHIQIQDNEDATRKLITPR